MEDKDKYVFIAEWYDATADMIKKFYFTYFDIDGRVEMYDIANRRLFLKRTPCLTVKLSDMFVGSVINVMSRQLKLVDYGNTATKSKLSQRIERTLAVIKPCAMHKIGFVVDVIYRNDLQTSRGRMIYISEKEARQLLIWENKQAAYSKDIEDLTSRPAAVFEVRGVNAIVKWMLLTGVVLLPDGEISIVGDLAELKSFCYSPLAKNRVEEEIKLFFPDAIPVHCTTAKFSNCTCCIIKPHIMRKGIAGQIIQALIDADFKITALEIMCFDHASAEDFYEVYKGVVTEYSEMVRHLSVGPCVAMEISADEDKEHCVTLLRRFAGPSDPEIARHLRPTTLRAKFGEDRVQNAIHCTDLPQDGLLEVEFIFKILARK